MTPARNGRGQLSAAVQSEPIAVAVLVVALANRGSAVLGTGDPSPTGPWPAIQMSFDSGHGEPDWIEWISELAAAPLGASVRAKGADRLASQYPPSFTLELATKDMVLVDRADREAGVDLPAAGAARQWMEDALADGAGEQVFSAVAATIADRARPPGTPVRRQP